MSTKSAIQESIDTAADAVGSVWPLHSFVTANPLAGFEDQPFHEAVTDAERLLGGDGYPSVDVFRSAWESGQIDPTIIQSELSAHGYETDPDTALERMAEADVTDTTAATDGIDRVDAVLTKWLSAFLDQGQAEWAMPDREQGFYDAFRAVARHDGEIPDSEAIEQLPEDPADAIRDCLSDQPIGGWQAIFECQLAALPGWTGFLKQRADDGGAWQSEYPVTLTEYLAVRLVLIDQFGVPVESDTSDAESGSDGVPLQEVWLSAWEATYRAELAESVSAAGESLDSETEEERPDAQLVFCIDTRSEIIRRHIEATGDYETHGYAGFFGIPMRYDDYDSAVTVDACPPILDAKHRITDRPTNVRDSQQADYDSWHDTLGAGKKALKAVKHNATTAFSFVESTGAGYGVALAVRTLLPSRFHDLVDATDERVPDDHEFCEPTVDYNPDAVYELREGLTLEEKVEYAETAFDLMGWEQFARVVVFAGHASESANNPFDSSLDCGACAGNPGGPSARVLAAICNDDAVRAELSDHGIEIPDDTVFVAGEHNTTTDEIELYTENIPESHEEDIAQLHSDLETARAGSAAERTADMGADADSPVRDTERRAKDWAETRPEWGLAGNAGFVIGPRELTAGLDLDGRSFLHSYDYSTDPDGDALEAIMAGPMVVTQWINTQYYFATVDNAVYGSGSKVTHNPTGNVGVYQGNGGDLMTGLPQQSLMSGDDDPYHQPIRLSAVIHAPVERVTDILGDNDQLATLLDNNWLSLTVVDPDQEQQAFDYVGDLEWTPLTEAVEQKPASEPIAADD